MLTIINDTNSWITTLFLTVCCASILYLIIKINFINKTLNYLQIKVITTEEDCEEFIKDLRKSCEKHKAVGFDCEWVNENGHQNPVSLLQLSSYNGLCGLFRLNILKQIPKSLKDFLEDDSIYKLGVATADDAKYLSRDYEVTINHCLDLRHVVKACGFNSGGLANLAQQHVRVTLDKYWKIRCSNWEAEELTERQLKYAAADAHVAILIYDKVVKKYQWGFLSLLLPNCFIEYKLKYNIYNKYVNKKYCAKNSNRSSLKKKSNKSSDRYSIVPRTKPLYDHCFLQAPDGELLCAMNKRKAKWYVVKELADIILDEPLTVRLRFEPVGRAVGEIGKYFQTVKENKCVVCGSTESYIRKNVVPREYRKYFPEIMKEHSSHDVVLLCSPCHKRSNCSDLLVRRHLEELCGAPLEIKKPDDHQIVKIRSYSRALLLQPENIPGERKKILEDTLLEYYPEYSEITQDLLETASRLHASSLIEGDMHGEKVVKYFQNNGSLFDLEMLWRRHFLDTMVPQHMPQLWSLNHTEKRIRILFDEDRLNKSNMEAIGISHWNVK